MSDHKVTETVDKEEPLYSQGKELSIQTGFRS